MRLDRYLANAGVGTRQEVKKVIRKGFVTVNDEVITKADTSIDDQHDIVYVGDERIHYEEFAYILLHKPEGYLSATEDRDEKTVMELIEGFDHRDLHIVGRLDKDTTGFLLLTDDGQFTHHLTSPKHHMGKRYHVTLDREMDEDSLTKLRKPVMMDGDLTLPSEVTLLSPRLVEIILYEGKHHQVKRMIERVGYTVAQLHRVAIGNVSLGDLPKGSFRKLTLQEINELKGVS
jgi:16S rRNA pseudouridine516 synthase